MNLPGLDAIKGDCAFLANLADELDDLGAQPDNLTDRIRQALDRQAALVAAVEAAAEFMDESCMADECDWCDRCLHGYGDLRAALAPFRGGA